MKRALFSLFQSHLDLAHSYWQKLVQKGDLVIDATCGNGQDTLVLAKLCLGRHEGLLYAIDILPQAIENTHKYLQNELEAEILERIYLINGCHSQFPKEILLQSAKLITYNLGYLPGGNKSLTTQVESTLESLNNAMKLIQHGGAISITLYPGHPEGQREEEKILSFVREIPSSEWNCCLHQWINRKKSPSLLFLQRFIK